MILVRPAAVAILALGTACAGSRDDLVRRASFDLSCPEAQLNVVELTSDTRGVTGCGQRATYVLRCELREFGNCTRGEWVMNNTAGGDSGGR